MSSTYAGNAANYPADLTLPTDGDTFRASTFRPGYEGLADRTANINIRTTTNEERLDLLQAFNFPILVSGPGGASQNGAFFSPPTGKWYVLCNNEDVRSSVNNGLTWAQESGVATAGAGENCLNGDADASGNVVVTTNTRYVFELTASTSTWTKVDVAGEVITRIGHVAWTPANGGRWVHSIADLGWRTSENRTTWSAATTPPTGTWTDTVMGVAANKTSGRVVAMGALKVAYTDDGGVNWTTLAGLDSTIASPSVASLAHNADEGAWYFTIGKTSGTPSCEVWRSGDDGLTWMKMATLAAFALYKIACAGDVLIGIAKGASRNEVVYSRDSGATWKKTAFWPTGTPCGMFYGGGRPILVTSSNVYVGLSRGSTDLGSLT